MNDIAETDPSTLRSHVLSTVQNKGWYYNQDGVFSWSGSVKQIAQTLGVEPGRAQDAIENSFTPEALTQVTVAQDDKEIEVPLLQVLKENGYPMWIWTEGDEAWQRTKCEKTGVWQYVDKKNFSCAPKEKSDLLEKIVAEIIQKYGEGACVVVVDDKAANTEKSQQILGGIKGINAFNYHLKLNDLQADPTAFFTFLQNDVREAAKGKPIITVLDFDGVIANTDGVLLGKATDALTALMETK